MGLRGSDLLSGSDADRLVHSELSLQPGGEDEDEEESAGRVGSDTVLCSQEGVGDTPDSYAYDGNRVRKWNVTTTNYGKVTQETG